MAKTLITTKYGQIEGIREEGCIVFKGIPYAKIPIGNLRFAAPGEPEPFKGIYKADHFGNRCPQVQWDSPQDIYKKEFYNESVYATPISEDSLSLNIWVPDKACDEKLPVAFYIHGGAFLGGTGHEVEFRTNAYAQKNVILITINYRLGLLGFFAHPWVYEEDTIACGNYAVLDQIAALKWVRTNIAEFGGDPKNITIFGQSAGAMSVQTLLSTSYTKGMFSKVIIQSAGGYPSVLQRDISLEDGFEIGKRAVELAGISSLQELRNLPIERILEIQESIIMESIQAGKGLPFAPVINGHVLENGYNWLAENAKTHDVPTMIGSTRHDIMVTEEEIRNCNSKMKQSCIGWSLMQEKIGRVPSYVYYFRHDLPGDTSGAFHSSELWYMFGTLKNCWRPMTDGDYELSNRMLGYWTNFMKTGNPNDGILEEWKTCSSKYAFVMELDAK